MLNVKAREAAETINFLKFENHNHSRNRAKQFGGVEESAQMFKSKYFQIYSVFSRKSLQ